MASSAVQSAKEINEKHHVVNKSMKAASITGKKVAGGIKFISKSVKSNGNRQKAESGRSNDRTQTSLPVPTDSLYPDVEW